MLQTSSSLINRINESATIATAQRARELKAQGIKVVNLSLGEPDFETPQYIKDAAIEAINNNVTKYPPVPGFPELRAAISSKLQRENGLTYTPNEISVSTGAKQCLANAILSTVNEDDEVILFSPYWVTYKEIVNITGAKVIELKAGIEQDFKVSVDQLSAAITPKTRMIIFSSPCNPTGSVYDKTELEGIAKLVSTHPKALVISDEIYEYINYDGEHHSIASFEGMKERTLIVNGASKGFAMTGWRLGFMAGPETIIKYCNKLQGQITSGTCSIAQMAATAAFNGGKPSVAYMIDTYRERKELMRELLGDIVGLKVNNPKGAFYLFVDANAVLGKKTPEGKSINTTLELAQYLLEEKHVAIVAGEAFGLEGCFRISFAAANEELIDGAKRIKQGIENLV